jgi:hypothetical protein
MGIKMALKEQESRTGPEREGCASGRRKRIRKGRRMVNAVQKMCTHVCKCKNDTCLNYSRNQGRKVKRTGRRS